MIRWATPADAPALETFLSDHAETSMFLRGNLATAGVGQGDSPYSTDFLLWEEAGALAGVFGHSRDGYLMIQCPSGAPAALDAAAQALAGRRVLGLTGEVAQTGAFLQVLGLADRLRMNDVEPLYRHDLTGLPTQPVPARSPDAQDHELLVEWVDGYLRDTGMLRPDPDDHAREIAQRVARMTHNPDVTLLLEDDRPIAMAAVNARVAPMIQLGSVFTPRSGRGRGAGRRVTQALLQREQARGARIAVLFSNNDAASRAYEAAGFVKVGAYRIALTAGPVTLGGVAA